MCSLLLFSLHSNDLLKYKNCVIKTYFQRDFVYKKYYLLRKISFVEAGKEKFGTVTKVKLVTKIKKPNQLYFGTLVLLPWR